MQRLILPEYYTGEGLEILLYKNVLNTVSHVIQSPQRTLLATLCFVYCGLGCFFGFVFQTSNPKIQTYRIYLSRLRD